MRWMSRSRSLAAVVVLLAFAAALSLTVGWTGSAGSRAAAATEYEIALETTEALADVRPGDRVPVVIQNKVPDTALSVVENILLCPGSFSGVPSTEACVALPQVPASGAWSDPSGLMEFFATIPVEGENTFPPNSNRPNEVSCRPGEQCTFAFTYHYFRSDFSEVLVNDVTSLKFTVQPPIQVEGCADPQPGKLVDTVGPDRLASSEVAWAQQRCQGGRALDLDYSAKNEVSGRDEFRDGSGDVFFGAGGVTAGENAAASGKRKSVPVPVALNAQVVALLGAYPSPSQFPGSDRKEELSDVKLTAAQIADLMINPASAFSTGAAGGGTPGVFADEVLAANSQLMAMNDADRIQLSVAAYSTPEVGHWIASRYLERNVPSTWKYPDTAAFEHPNQPIGSLFNFRPLFPDENTSKALVGDRAGLGKLLTLPAFGEECTGKADGNVKPGCVNVVFTDLATARDLLLPVVQVETTPGSGRFVAPTAESMAAAADDMETLPDGSLVPDLDKKDPNAYPFTFVEYANAPAEQFLDDACQPTGKLQVVRDVLSYLVTDGQGQLAKGLVPLPGAMAAQAAAATQRVGAEVPARCAPDESDGGEDGSGGGDLVGAGSALPGSGAGSGAAAAGAVGDHPTRPVTTTGQQQALNAANNAAIPLFAGMAALVLLVPLSALALTNGLTSGTAFGSAGRRLPPRVARALAVATAPLRRAMASLIRR